MNKGSAYCLGLGGAVIVLFVLNLLLGSVSIPARDVVSILLGNEASKASWQFIVLESRLPQAITATLCGAALAVSGLMLQTAFRNPLAGPSVFGINSGAGLGVALVMLFLGGGLSVGSVSITGFAAILSATAEKNPNHDWLYLQFGHLAAQLLCHRRGRQVVYGMGHGLVWRCIDGQHACVCHRYHSRLVWRPVADKTP